MALTRRALKAMGIEDEKIDEIINLHTETVDALKNEIDTYKAQAEASEGIQKDLENARAELDDAKKNSWKAKYEAVRDEYDGYKSEQEKKATHQAKESAYKKLLQDAGVSSKRINSVLKVTDIDSFDLDKNGAIKNSGDELAHIQDEWGDFITSSETYGAQTATPPATEQSGSMSKEDIMKIKDAGKRQKAIAENHELFGY